MSVGVSDPAASVRITASGQAAEARRVALKVARGRDLMGDPTVRERVVADLPAIRDSNAEVAERLFVNMLSAKKHVSKVLMKFRIRSRTEAVAKILDSRHVSLEPAR